MLCTRIDIKNILEIISFGMYMDYERKRKYDKDRYERLHGSKPKDDSIECDICGGYWKPDNKWRHLNTKKHMRAYSKYIYENVKK